MAKTLPTWLPAYSEIDEPSLKFHSIEESYHSVNPIEGLSHWGPYDASVAGSLRPNPVKVAIISPENSFAILTNFLKKIEKPVVHTSRDEYVADWPGFRPIFQTNLEIPSEITDRLVKLIPESTIQEIRQSANPEVAFLDVVKNHARSLMRISHEFHVLVVYVPSQWAEFRERKDENYDYDLHDALKVFSAPNNTPIQIIEETSLHYPDQARVMWWLALALYVKGGGIPWKLATKTQDTAFVGLSYGISRINDRQRIVMGCSQVFDESGQGLKFLLYPVEQAVFRGRNPFMSTEDARRLFERIREIYQRVNDRRPQRVVVHKTTHFTNDEMKGIATALSGIEDIELLQIQQDTSWRALAYDHGRDRVHTYPVKRGTAVPLNRYTFLLWTQGNVSGIAGPHLNYYQEKRGIPSPLVVRRFRGTCSLETAASEILQLTKMNWNHHQLYDRLPVTLKFSSDLARISKQVQSVWRDSYDFRFFM